MSNLQDKTQSEVARQMGQLLIDMIVVQVERQALSERVTELEAELKAKAAQDDG